MAENKPGEEISPAAKMIAGFLFAAAFVIVVPWIFLFLWHYLNFVWKFV